MAETTRGRILFSYRVSGKAQAHPRGSRVTDAVRTGEIVVYACFPNSSFSSGADFPWTAKPEARYTP